MSFVMHPSEPSLIMGIDTPPIRTVGPVVRPHHGSGQGINGWYESREIVAACSPLGTSRIAGALLAKGRDE